MSAMRPQRALRLRVVYAICMLAGASTHATILWRHGLFWDYGVLGVSREESERLLRDRRVWGALQVCGVTGEKV